MERVRIASNHNPRTGHAFRCGEDDLHHRVKASQLGLGLPKCWHGLCVWVMCMGYNYVRGSAAQGQRQQFEVVSTSPGCF